MRRLKAYYVIPYSLILVLVLAACNLDQASVPTPNDENIIFVTATPDLPTPNAQGEIVITATPDTQVVSAIQDSSSELVAPDGAALPAVAQPVIAAQAAPEIDLAQVEEVLREARGQLRDGYFEQAVTTFRTLLAQGVAVPADARQAAAFELGQAALREGLFAEAVSAFDLLIGEFTAGETAARAYFLRGDARLGLGQWRLAIADFEQYLALRPGLIDSYAHERIADAHLALGETQAALVAYERALLADRTLVPLLVLREKVARIHQDLGQFTEAVAQYDAILQVARNAAYRATIELYAAQALLRAGQPDRAIPRARLIFDTYPETTAAYNAMQILLDNGVSIEGFQRGKVSFRYGDYTGAIEAFNEFSSRFELDAIPAELYLLLGRAYREVGNPAAAIVAFQTIIDRYASDPLLGEALLEQGRTRFLSGDVPGAIRAYLAIADNYGYLADTAPVALWRAGYLYGTNNEPVQSRQIFVRLADAYPQSSWASNGLLLAASAAVKNQDWAIAENLYGRIASLTQGDDRAAAYLWVGRIALERGDQRAADEAFSLAIQAAPDGYFAARASDIRQGLAPFTAPAQVRFDFDESTGRAEAEAWLRTTFGIGQVGDLSTPSAELRADERMVRGTELWAMANYDEALGEFRALLDEKRNARDALSLYQMAIYLRDIGAYSSSIVAAADVINAAQVPTLAAPPYIARMRYPAYFSGLVLEQVERYGFDPLLVFALIRQESLYATSAVSSASARGLMQVIPSTGQYIAGRLAWPDYQDSDLLKPYVSIAFGSYYLAEQLRLFDGNVAAALAAYNAGPGRALDWVALSGGEVDLLVTTITFEETRLYIERIYSHYNIYRALYGV